MSSPSPQARTHAFVERLRAGETSVMADIYDDYGATLFGILSRIVRDDSLAEDLVQETFVRVWTQRSTYDTRKGTLFTWMLNIGRNLAIDMLRSSAYKVSSNNQSVDELVGIHEPEADTAVVPETIDVRDHVDRLPNDQRLIVELTYFRGLTQSEIADQFGIPLGTVKSRLRLAMNALRAIYAEVNS